MKIEIIQRNKDMTLVRTERENIKRGAFTKKTTEETKQYYVVKSRYIEDLYDVYEVETGKEIRRRGDTWYAIVNHVKFND